ncbi:hypothetical protein Microterr_30030 [Microbacterium terricola]|uniref:Uncharacterized protein n=1 Tax=Microbacterium terricola TaxID=344163 RepID=A0ABM8E2Z9_9MICO|nr:hypothetical protein Microterr_30030 [Microbacterium terricola]
MPETSCLRQNTCFGGGGVVVLAKRECWFCKEGKRRQERVNPDAGAQSCRLRSAATTSACHRRAAGSAPVKIATSWVTPR